MPTEFADLEIALRGRGDGIYSASFLYSAPEADDAGEHAFTAEPELELNPAELARLGNESYPKALSAAFFTEKVKDAFLKSVLLTEQSKQKLKLRVRLSIEAGALELHKIRWETLRHPGDPAISLFAGENIIFSRFLASGQDWRPIRLRAKGNLTALVVIGNPESLLDQEESSGLKPLDVAEQFASAKKALAGMKILGLGKDLPAELSEGAATLENIKAQLAAGVDILYLVCHGTLDKLKGPLLWLEEEKPTAGSALCQCIWGLEERPRLVVLASCQSAGKGGGDLAGLGPRLVEVGVPAAVAMQSNIQTGTAQIFMDRFFMALSEDGQIDRAMSVARGAILAEPDAWVPVLFMRLKRGSIWYVPGFGETFEHWDAICGFSKNGECVPIIGPDVAEHVFGTTRSLAAEVAEKSRFPMEQHNNTDLAKVAQVITILNSRKAAENAVQGVLKERLKRSQAGDTGMDQVLDEIAARGIQQADDPLTIAAKLKAKVFLNASGNSLFAAYLRQAGKEPVEIDWPWRDERRDGALEADLPEPTEMRPLLYYVFGQTKMFNKPGTPRRPDTWALTEDDLFDYLIKTTRYRLVPGVVKEALVTGSILFLGFPLDDWKFRVLFRQIMSLEGIAEAMNFNHAGVQVDPGEGVFGDVKKVKTYLETYFTKTINVDLFWGSSTDFLRELKKQMEKT